MTKYLDYAGLEYLTDRIKTEIETHSEGAPIAGLIIPYAGAAAPAGYLMCDGTTYSVADYPELYAAIGVTYGGTAGTRFKVPDLSGRVAVGKGSTYDLGASGGEATHTLTIGEMPAHKHTWQSNWSAAGWQGMSPMGFLTANWNADVNQYGGSFSHDSFTENGKTVELVMSTGGSGAHNNMQPYLATNYLISTGQRPTGDEPSSAAILQKVNELEAEVTQQQQTLDSISPADWFVGDYCANAYYAPPGVSYLTPDTVGGADLYGILLVMQNAPYQSAPDATGSWCIQLFYGVNNSFWRRSRTNGGNWTDWV